MGSISKFCERMRWYCDEANVGYDQSNRWDIRVGGESDCSSLVIQALRDTGFDTGAASYTGNMSDELTARGWRRLPADISTCRPGDILLNDTHHVCAVVAGSGWGATIAQASIDENGRVSGGRAGDQTGTETNTRPVYTYRHGWDCILRWGGGSDAGDDDDGVLDVDGYVGPKTITEWQGQCATPQDGVVSGQGQAFAKWYPNVTSVTFEGGGSELMRAVQARVGVSGPTGVIARGSVCMLQGWLVLGGYDVGGDKAGVLGEGTAKALQRSLNDGKWKHDER